MKPYAVLSTIVLVFVLTLAISLNLNKKTIINSEAEEHLPLLTQSEMTKLGLELDSVNCPGLYKVRGVSKPTCTHGPDPLITPVPGQTTESLSTLPPFPCDGDGVSGFRLQALYLRPSNTPSKFTPEFIARYKKNLKKTNNIYVKSAAQTGGYRGLRFVHDSNCEPVISEVVVNPGEESEFGNIINALSNQGYSQSNRKYVVLVDDGTNSQYCGQGSVHDDEIKSYSNQNNSGPDWAAIYCWADDYGLPELIAHEIGHTLGAVQLSAPHSTGYWHCTDDYDVMCYKDSSDGPPRQRLCISGNSDSRLDCNKDDYFSTNPPEGNYLYTHWNTADNKFLAKTQNVVSNGMVAGNIFKDANSNGVKNNETNDPSIPGITINLWQVEGVASSPFKSTVSANNFSFINLPGGKYQIVRPQIPTNLTFISCSDVKTPATIPTDKRFFYCKVPTTGNKFNLILKKWTPNGTSPFTNAGVSFSVPSTGTTNVDFPLVSKPVTTLESFE